MRRIFIDKRIKLVLVTKMKVNPPNKVNKGIKDPLAITVERKVTHQINVGAMERRNSMVNVSIAISMVTKKMSAKKNQNLNAIVTNVKSMVIRHSNANPKHSIQLNNLLKLYLDGTKIPGADVTIVENMDTLV